MSVLTLSADSFGASRGQREASLDKVRSRRARLHGDTAAAVAAAAVAAVAAAAAAAAAVAAAAVPGMMFSQGWLVAGAWRRLAQPGGPEEETVRDADEELEERHRPRDGQRVERLPMCVHLARGSESRWYSR